MKSKQKKRYKYSRSYKKLGDCKGKKKRICSSDPNCVETKIICRRRPNKSKRKSKRKLYYGPILPNDISKRKLFNRSKM